MNTLTEHLPTAALAQADTLPWVPAATPGKWSKLLRCLSGDRGFVELLRMDPGVAMPLHHHHGEVHAFNLQGHRVLHTGQRVGPGDYVHEPAGHTDWWRVDGEEPMVALAVVMGAVDFIDAQGALRYRVTADTVRAEHEAWYRAQGLPLRDWTEPA